MYNDNSVKFLVKDDDKRLVYGIVYEPDVVDTQGDYTDSIEIEKGAHRFMEFYQDIGEAHFVTSPDIKLVESYIAPADFDITNPITKELQKVQKGSWVIVVKVYNDKVWDEVKDGKLTGFSFEGTARGEDEKTD